MPANLSTPIKNIEKKVNRITFNVLLWKGNENKKSFRNYRI
ncbi:MAG TPA: hypothetical protein VN704_00325 [Verrucomicrobiae bacterium]|nr:hypothetical protein [Verrucomicrobiae bacterium]